MLEAACAVWLPFKIINGDGFFHILIRKSAAVACRKGDCPYVLSGRHLPARVKKLDIYSFFQKDLHIFIYRNARPAVETETAARSG